MKADCGFCGAVGVGPEVVPDGAIFACEKCKEILMEGLPEAFDRARENRARERD